MLTYTHGPLTFDVRDGGPPAGTPVILLHGFPETASSWDGVVPGLQDAGFRTLTPNQRGYSPGARPKGRRSYTVIELVADVLALADQADAGRFHLVGHDWGGIVAWYLAANHPDRLLSVTSLSTPHPAAFQASLLQSAQLLKSYYMLVFQLPGIPERSMLAGGGKGLRNALRKSGLHDAAIDRYLETLRQPGALTAALNYYRALPFGTLRCGKVHVPTMHVWSTEDTALGRRGAELTARYVTGPYRFEVLPGVSHWIPEEEPAEVTRLLLAHFGSGS